MFIFWHLPHLPLHLWPSAQLLLHQRIQSFYVYHRESHPLHFIALSIPYYEPVAVTFLIINLRSQCRTFSSIESIIIKIANQ